MEPYHSRDGGACFLASWDEIMRIVASPQIHSLYEEENLLEEGGMLTNIRARLRYDPAQKELLTERRLPIDADFNHLKLIELVFNTRALTMFRTDAKVTQGGLSYDLHLHEYHPK